MGLLDFIRGGKKSSPTIRTAQDVQKQQAQELPPLNPSALPYIPQYLDNPPADQQQTEGIQFPQLNQQPQQDYQQPQDQFQQQPVQQLPPLEVDEPQDPMAGFMPSIANPNAVMPPQNYAPQDMPVIQPPTEMFQDQGQALVEQPVQSSEPDTVSAVLADNTTFADSAITETQTPTAVKSFQPMPMVPDLKMPEFPSITSLGGTNQSTTTDQSDSSNQDEFTSMSDLANSQTKSLDDLLKVDLPPLPKIDMLSPVAPVASETVEADTSVQTKPIIDLPPLPKLPDLSSLNFPTFAPTTAGATPAPAEDDSVQQDVNTTNIDEVSNSESTQTDIQNDLQTEVTEAPVQDEVDTTILPTNINEFNESQVSTVEVTTNNDTEIAVGSEMHTDLNQDVNLVMNESADLVDSGSAGIAPVMMGVETQNIASLQSTAIETEKSAEEKIEEAIPSASSKRVISKVAFLGLDGGSMDQSTGNALVSVVKDLVKHKFEIIIDSKKGYGEHISQTAAAVKSGVKGIFLKPYLSNDFSLPAKQLTESFNTSLVYSNYIERLKSIFSNSDIFVFFETGGIYNVSLMTTLWAISKMYLGQNKPIVLVGNAWKKKIESLKELLGLTKSDMEAVIQIDSIQDLIEKIKSIENSYHKKSDMMNVEKIIDKRIEGDETDFIVLPA